MGKCKPKSLLQYVLIFIIIGSILELLKTSLEDLLRSRWETVFIELGHLQHYISVFPTGIFSGFLGIIAFYLIFNLNNSKKMLEQERNQLLSIFDSIDEPIYVSDIYTNKILFANKYLSNLIGGNPIGKICFRVLHDETGLCSFCTNNKILELDGAPYHWNYYNNKLKKHFSITDRIIKWSCNRNVRFEIAIDITEQLQSKSKALEKTELLNCFIQASTDFVFIWDKDLNLIEINDVGLSLFHNVSNRAELLGKNIEYVFFNFNKSSYLNKYSEVLSTGNTLFYNHTITNTKGEIIHLSVRVFKAGNHIGQVATDITSSVLAEEEMKTAIEDLTRSNKDLEQFAYVASHDLKAPLRNIHSLAEWLLKEYKGKLDKQGVEFLELMLSRVVRMNSFIDGLLRYSKLDLNKDTYSIINIKQLIEGVISSISIPNHISISISDPLPEITGKKTLIEQVFLNLIDNAINHNDKPEGEVKINCTEKADLWQFNIEDNGPGIDPLYQEKVFDFFQTLKSKDYLEKTGMGLPIVKKIILHHGGTIWIDSIPTKNCTIFFTIPK